MRWSILMFFFEKNSYICVWCWYIWWVWMDVFTIDDLLVDVFDNGWHNLQGSGCCRQKICLILTGFDNNRQQSFWTTNAVCSRIFLMVFGKRLSWNDYEWTNEKLRASVIMTSASYKHIFTVIRSFTPLCNEDIVSSMI